MESRFCASVCLLVSPTRSGIRPTDLARDQWTLASILQRNCSVHASESAQDQLNMFDYENFKDVFGSSKEIDYDAKIVKNIRKNRESLEGELFIDKLLKALNVPKGTKSHRYSDTS